MRQNEGNRKRPLWEWILLFVGAFFLGLVGMGVLWTGYEVSDSFGFPGLSIMCSALVLVLYAVLVKLMERHWPTNLSLRRLVPHTLLGLLVGFMYMVLVVCTIVASNCATVVWDGFSGKQQFSVLMMFLIVAVGEEMVFRGIIFRLIDERWSTWVALLVSALFFGLVHITNDNATWWSSLAIAIEAGLLLGAAYKWSGSLWVPIGIHWAWNYTQGNIFGFAVSGTDAGSTILTTTVDGPEIVTGGAFGPEASIIAVLFGILYTIVFLYNRRLHRSDH